MNIEGNRIIMPWGWAEFTNNELLLVSTVPDPPKVYMGAQGGGSMGALSFGRLRSDGRLEEMVLLQGKQDERYRGTDRLTGELTIHVRDHNPALNDDAQMKLVMELRHDRILIPARIQIVRG